jgi:hypothetical protein
MGLPVNDKNKKKDSNNKNSKSGSKFINKPSTNTKGASTQRPHKAGGTRGS